MRRGLKQISHHTMEIFTHLEHKKLFNISRFEEHQQQHLQMMSCAVVKIDELKNIATQHKQDMKSIKQKLHTENGKSRGHGNVRCFAFSCNNTI